MKIALFGATGRTGKIVLQKALKEGHTVHALVRTPGKLTTQYPNLLVIQGDIKDAAKVAETIQGADAVISTLGPTSNQPIFAVSTGTRHILNAMQQQNVKRLIISAGAGIGDPNDQPGGFDRLMGLLLRLFARNVVSDMAQAAALVRSSDRDWTITRAPMLLDAPGTGHPHGTYLGQKMNPRLPREDFALFILAQLGTDAWLHKAPVVSA